MGKKYQASMSVVKISSEALWNAPGTVTSNEKYLECKAAESCNEGPGPLSLSSDSPSELYNLVKVLFLFVPQFTYQ